jgi:hypothetical protein
MDLTCRNVDGNEATQCGESLHFKDQGTLLRSISSNSHSGTVLHLTMTYITDRQEHTTAYNVL